MAFSKVMTKEGAAKFTERFNASRRSTAFSNLSNRIDQLDMAILCRDKKEIEYIVGLMQNSLDMILRCNN